MNRTMCSTSLPEIPSKLAEQEPTAWGGTAGREQSRKMGASNVTVKDDLFRLHDYKQKTAEQLLAAETMIPIPAYFSDTYFSPKYFGTKEVTVKPNLRLECVFIDWLGDDWRYGTPHDTQRLNKFLEAVMNAPNKLGG